ncbi:MAG: hypothetical protein II819_05435 [Fibrobacter sp.]|nr:hypothetical protein [Fibrobacter sp.]
MTTEETERATYLLPVVSDSLREEAALRGYDLDEMVATSTTLASVATSVTVDIIARQLRTATTGEPMNQESQSALGYSWSGTYAVPGGGLPIMRNDLKRLGIMSQKLGVVDFGNTGYRR